MIELLDNLTQAASTVVATAVAGMIFYKSRKEAHFLLTCFLGTFMLGSLYWAVYNLLNDYTPQIFYVAELAWLASFLFLLVLMISLKPKDSKNYPLAWLSPMVGLALMLFFMQRGEYLSNLLYCSLTSAIGYYAINGLLCERKKEDNRRLTPVYLWAMLFIITEYCLWVSSCFWVSDTWTNSYFWFDFLLTAQLLCLPVLCRKAVDK